MDRSVMLHLPLILNLPLPLRLHKTILRVSPDNRSRRILRRRQFHVACELLRRWRSYDVAPASHSVNLAVMFGGPVAFPIRRSILQGGERSRDYFPAVAALP